MQTIDAPQYISELEDQQQQMYQSYRHQVFMTLGHLFYKLDVLYLHVIKTLFIIKL